MQITGPGRSQTIYLSSVLASRITSTSCFQSAHRSSNAMLVEFAPHLVQTAAYDHRHKLCLGHLRIWPIAKRIKVVSVSFRLV